MIIEITTEEKINEMMEMSQRQPVFLFKHSTRCPVSTSAWAEFEHFTTETDIACYRVLVVEHRFLSLKIADMSGVTHQSPQAILFYNGKANWHTSHYDITKKSLKDAERGVF